MNSINAMSHAVVNKEGETLLQLHSLESGPLQEGRGRSIPDFLFFFFFFLFHIGKNSLTFEGLVESENCHFLFKALDSK